MSEIINLRVARKAKRRVEADAAAAANRLRFGRTRAEREAVALEAGRAGRQLDGAKLSTAKLDAADLDGAAPGPHGSAVAGEATGAGD